MKKTMEKPEMEFIRFQDADVIATSGMTLHLVMAPDGNMQDSGNWVTYQGFQGFGTIQ